MCIQILADINYRNEKKMTFPDCITHPHFLHFPKGRRQAERRHIRCRTCMQHDETHYRLYIRWGHKI